MMMKRFLLIATMLGLGACAHAKIPLTDIDDTDDNREILAVVETYHRAVEQLDADAIIALVSTRYYEDNGNTDSKDDYNYTQFKHQLREDFKRTRAIQLSIRVDSVEVEDNSAYAEMFYEIKAQNEYPSGLKWNTNSDRTRLRFELQEGKWLIVAGL